VTVLFADIEGSTDLQEEIDPEVWHGIMDRFFGILADGVHRFEGTINQYTGDGIMALFGAPIAHEDHAHRACYAALWLADELERYTREIKRTRGLVFSVRMGVNSGEVVVGKIGDDLRMDYTAQGQTVNLAARMESLASAGRAYLAEPARRLVEGWFELEDLGEFAIKGVHDPVRVHELRGIGAHHTRLDVSRARGLSRFVGRADDMQALQSALGRCFEGQGQVVGIVADAGVGKSRLCYEFLEGCRARGLRVLEGRGVPHGKNLPFLPILEVFRDYYGITDSDDDRTVREKIAGRLLLLDEAFRESLPLLFEFFGVPDPDNPGPQLDPEDRERRLYEILRKVVSSGRPETPIVALVEDLHWIDGGSQAFLDQWAEAIADGPGLLIVNFRPEYRAEWMGRPHYRQIPLAPLGPEAVRELVGDLLGEDPSVAGLADTIYERTRGNPFFTEEVVRSLIESGYLEGIRGAYRLTKSIGGLAVPDSVQALLAARIDRLPEREKRVLQTAAVIGKEFSEPVLSVVAELPEPELRDALAHLKSAEFVFERSLYPIAEYAFKHPLTRDVAYGSQLGDRRSRIHAAVAGAIEAESPEKLDERAGLISHHLEEGGELLDAARWQVRAARWVVRGITAETVERWRKVLEILDGVEESPETIALGVEALGQLVTLGGRLGLPREEVEEDLRRGEELAGRSGDPRVRMHFLHAVGAHHVLLGYTSRAAAPLEEALRLADQLEDPSAGVGLRYWRGLQALWDGPVGEGLRLSEEALALLREDPRRGRELIGFDPEVGVSGFRGLFLGLSGRLAEAQPVIERALRLARERNERAGLMLAEAFAGWLHECRGDAALAVSHVTRSVRMAEESGARGFLGLAYMTLARALLLAGRYADVVETTDRAAGMTNRVTNRWTIRAVGLLGVGRPEEALAEVRGSAVEAVGRHFEAEAYLALAAILTRTLGADARPEIEASLEKSRELFDETGIRVRLPVLNVERSRLARILRDDATADRELREAHRLYTEMGATGHAERIAAELGE
jgi:class 3 adenylate cyclase/tetratricopeptide (TPR) repeat protein